MTDDPTYTEGDNSATLSILSGARDGRRMVDLAALLVAEIDRQREEINASPMARALAGRLTFVVDLDCNLRMRRLDVKAHLDDEATAA